ncbi:MAG: AfsR/SARP family transcriptional regulator [Candidatus Limnocylindrales bacterium]
MSDWLGAELWDASDHTALASLLARVAVAPSDSIEVGGAFSRQLAKTLAYFRLGDRAAAEAALRLVESTAEAQASPIQRRLADLQRALLEGPEATAAEIAAATPEDDAFIGVFAREIAKTLGKLSPAAYLVVVRAARLNPDRWRTFLRPAVEDGGNEVGAERAAAILDEIGEIGDVARLRAYARRMRRPPERWGEALARRLAPRVWIEDLGLARICVGDRVIDGRSIRRRALALLLYLLGQPAGAATPDQIIEALWPDVDPDAALNSVHQTIYVLRRVVDPDYKAGMSPEYLHFDSDMVWLERDLVDSRSWRCMRLLAGREWNAEQVNEIVANYRGRFAGDFAYDEWASPFRDRLHALYLSVMEQAVAGKIGHRDARWRLWVGQQAIQVDPEADSIEALVIGLYRAVDATSAAREQYAHYASAMRDQLGVDPPALEDMPPPP